MRIGETLGEDYDEIAAGGLSAATRLVKEQDVDSRVPWLFDMMIKMNNFSIISTILDTVC